mmetsp:Transcript_10915/g.36177  ORF Transcript_10915/g.36177 Transcript_10915/m.36177 type:complete len:210 (-) Transcript_10915:343-972(-)
MGSGLPAAGGVGLPAVDAELRRTVCGAAARRHRGRSRRAIQRGGTERSTGRAYGARGARLRYGENHAGGGGGAFAGGGGRGGGTAGRGAARGAGEDRRRARTAARRRAGPAQSLSGLVDRRRARCRDPISPRAKPGARDGGAAARGGGAAAAGAAAAGGGRSRRRQAGSREGFAGRGAPGSAAGFDFRQQGHGASLCLRVRATKHGDRD